MADQIAPAAIVAVVLGLIVPWPALAHRSDLLLAALVLFTALQIDPGGLRGLRRLVPVIASLSIGVVLVLAGVAWVISLGFSGPVRDGVLCLGLASTEVASVGLIGLAGGDSLLALGILTGSLVVSATLGPVLAGVLGHISGDGSSLDLLGRFSLIVLLPLAAGLSLRGVRPSMQRARGALNGGAALTVCGLLYATVSGVDGGSQLAQDTIASAVFIAASAVLAALLVHGLRARDVDPAAMAFTTGLRDFAVAAALAGQAFGVSAASVAGVYGALMLLGGALVATWMRRHPART